jgi:succinyl-CoA synthetase alpha subunit
MNLLPPWVICAIISGDFGTAQGKIKALTEAGALIADTSWDVPQLI